jgi:hypothetical protein
VADDLPVVILPPRRPRGRPRATDPYAHLTTWVPTPVYDELVRRANARGDSVSGLVRTLLTLVVTRPPSR